MQKIKFIPSHFWDKQTMKLDSIVSNEQWQKVENICAALNKKYYLDDGCLIHAEFEQIISVGLFNNFIDLQIDKTCRCEIIVDRLIQIRNTELLELNPNYFK